MLPAILERAVVRFLKPRGDSAPARSIDPAALDELKAMLAAIERRHQWRSFLHVLKTCASHLVLEGDETDQPDH